MKPLFLDRPLDSTFSPRTGESRVDYACPVWHIENTTGQYTGRWVDLVLALAVGAAASAAVLTFL